MLLSLRNETRPPYARETLWADLKAGVTLVASYVPTVMALGVISGMGPLAGLWCGVFVGIIAAVCGGTRAMVSGPSAVLAVITATLLMGDGVSLPELAVIIVMAGAIQIVLGLAGVGRYVSYMPHIVLTGFMSGIGVLLQHLQRRGDRQLHGTNRARVVSRLLYGVVLAKAHRLDRCGHPRP